MLKNVSADHLCFMASFATHFVFW